MKTKIKTIKENGISHVNIGTAIDASDFFNQIIKPQFSNKDAIIAIHRALMEYIDNENAVFVLRMFGSAPQKKYDLLRRGFLTIYPNGQKVTYCDNTFAMPFAAIKIAGMSYGTDDLISYMNDKSLRCGFGTTTEERELSYYKWDGNNNLINLNNYGWYLAHIIPVGKEYNHKTLSEIFVNPSRSEWETETDNIRRPDNNLSDEELNILKAHFLRLVHPLNSFLVPKRTLLAYDGANIGEEPELINLVQDFIRSEFPKEYAELAEKMQVPAQQPAVFGHIEKIAWGESESSIRKARSSVKQKQKRQNQLAKTGSYDEDQTESLERALKSIGKSAFLKLYPHVKIDPSISVEEICKIYPEYAKYSEVSQGTRLSSTRSIIKNDLSAAALESITTSKNISAEDRKLASEYLRKC